MYILLILVPRGGSFPYPLSSLVEVGGREKILETRMHSPSISQVLYSHD